jgi:glycosyltransferase involved in cell wall biosynthesis
VAEYGGVSLFDEKIDIVTWAKNGASLLPTVLKRIDRAIPSENICHKILVDDHSTDQTVEIARDFNWDVYANQKGGIPSGANEALKHVDRDFFVSIEQDIILSEKWWNTIPKYMDNPMVACAQGVRVPTRPVLRLLDERQQGPPEKRQRKTLVSMDNNIFRTEVVKSMGGFPRICPVCTDTVLMRKIETETPYKWIIDPKVVSLHVRNDPAVLVEHAYKLNYMCARTKYCSPPEPVRLTSLLRILLTSPFRAVQVAFKEKCPDVIWVYPLVRLHQLTIDLNYRRVLT